MLPRISYVAKDGCRIPLPFPCKYDKEEILKLYFKSLLCFLGVGIRGQLVLIFHVESWGLNSGSQAWQQGPLAFQSSCRPGEEVFDDEG